MDATYNINIERAVLSSILFDTDCQEEVFSYLKPENFYLPAHQKVFGTMFSLYSEGIPVDEEFIRKRIPQKDVDDSILIEILATTQITKPLEYAKQIHEDSTKRELATLATTIKKVSIEENIPAREALERVKSELTALENKQHSLAVGDWKTNIRKSGKVVTRETIKECEDIEFLIPNLITKNQITVLCGEGGVGKTGLTFACINRCFDQGKIDNNIYQDNDNGLAYTKDRVLKIMDRNGDDKINYYSGATSSLDEMLQDLEMLTRYENQGNRTIIVIDSLKDFIKGTINSDEAVNDLFNGYLKPLRDKFGATIIVLHHTTKTKDDDTGHAPFVGSQAIRNGVDSLIYVWKDLTSGEVLTKVDKMRAIPETMQSAYDLDFENNEMKDVDYNWDKQNGNLSQEEAFAKAEGETPTEGFDRGFLNNLKEAGAIRRYQKDGKWYFEKTAIGVMPEVTEFVSVPEGIL